MKNLIPGLVIESGLVLGGIAEEAPVHVLKNGYVSWKATEFSGRKGTDNAKWVVVPDEESVIDFSSSEGVSGAFLQQQPKKKVRSIEALVEYRVKIDKPGSYELSYIGGGVDRTADSAFVRIKELSSEYLQLGGWGKEPALQPFLPISGTFFYHEIPGVALPQPDQDALS